MKKISKKSAIQLIVAFLVVVSLSVLAFTIKLEEVPKSTLYKAEMSLVSGQVEKREKEGIWVKLKTNETVSQNDTIRVLGEGKAIITLDDGSAVRLNSNSIVKFASLDPKNIEIVNEGGEIYSRVIKAERNFVVKIEDEAYQAMGTAFQTVNTKAVKGVLVYESKVKTKKDNIEVPEGKKLYKKNETQKDKVNKVVDISTEEIEKDLFVQWNKKEDLKNEEFKKYLGVLSIKKATEAPTPDTKTPIASKPTTLPNPTTPDPSTASIYLTGVSTSKGIEFKWSVTDVDTSKGYKLVKSTTPNPVYPGNSATYISAGNSAYSMSITDGKTYNFRICQYTGGVCGVYSNNIVVTAPKVADGVVSKIDLYTYSVSQVKWLVTGFSDKGFKVVWSKTSGPTYPTRATDQYHYYSDPYYKIDSLSAFDGPGTYYVRVCEYLGGACGVYSNEVQLNL